MLTAYRRHLKRCAFARKGQNYTLCDCPVWCYGRARVGAPIRRSLGTRNWDEAIRRLMAIEVGEHSPLESRGCSVAEAAALYLADCEARNVRNSTLASYRRTLGTFPDMRLAHVCPAHVAAWRAGRKVAPGTQRKELEHLRFFFRWCIGRKLISENPAAAVKPPRVEQRITMPYSQDEVARLLAACDQIASDNPAETGYIRRRARCFVLLLLHSGLRRSDAAVLRRSALAGNRLTLRTEKTGVRLQVQLPAAVSDELSRLPAENPEFFFWSGRSKPATVTGNLWRTIQRLGAIADVHATPHRFRDTFACRLLETGADIRTVQKLLGHTSVRTTEKHYAPWIEAHQRLLDAATAKLDFLPEVRPVGLRKKSAR